MDARDGGVDLICTIVHFDIPPSFGSVGESPSSLFAIHPTPRLYC